MWSQLSSHLPQSLQSYADIDALKAKAQAIKGQLTEGLAEVLQDIEESEQVAKDNIEKYREQKRQEEFEQQPLGEQQQQDNHVSGHSLVTPNGVSAGSHFMDNFGSSSSSSLLDTSLFSNPASNGSDLSPTATLAASTYSVESSNASSLLNHASIHPPTNHSMYPFTSTDEHGALAVEAALDHSNSPLDESFDANSTSLSTSTVLNQSTVESDSEFAHRSAQSQAAVAELQAKLAQVQSLWFQAQSDNASLKTNYESRVQSLLAESQRKDDQLMESQKNVADIRSKMLNQLEDKEQELQRIQTSYAQLMQKQTDLASNNSQPAAATIVASPIAASPVGGSEEEEENLDVQAMLSDVSLPTEEKINMLVEEIEMLTNRAKHWKIKAKSTPAAAAAAAVAPVSTSEVAKSPVAAAEPAPTAADSSAAGNSELQDQIDELQSNLESVTDERDTLTEILNELKAESEKSLQEQAGKFQSDFQQLQAQVNELRAENVGLLHQLQSVAPVGADLSSEIASLQQALAAMKSENNALRSTHEADEHALSELHQQLTQERNSRPLTSPHHPSSVSHLNESHSELPTPAFSAPPSPLHGSFSKDPWSHDATTDLAPQLASLQEQYNALLKSHDKLSLFRSQAVTWKKAAEQSLLKLKGRKMELEARLQRHDERFEREKQELIKHVHHWKTQALSANPDSAPYPNGDVSHEPSPSPAHSNPEETASAEFVITDSPSTGGASAAAMDLMRTEHAAALALKDAQVDLARQQLAMQAEQISVLQANIAEMTQQVQQSGDRDRINEERIRAEYVLVTDDMAQKIHHGVQSLAARENELVEKNLQLTQLVGEIQTLKQQIQQLQEANQIAANHAQQVLTQELASREQEWAKQLQHSQNELQQLQQSQLQSGSQKDDELLQLTSKLQEAGTQLNMTNQMAQFLQNQLEEQKKMLQAKDGEIQQLQSQLMAASSDSSSVTQGLNERINQLTQHLMQAERELSEGRLTIESLEPRIFLAEANATAAENALNEANARADKAEMQVQELTTQLEAANVKADLAAAALAEANVRVEHASAGANDTSAQAEIAAAALNEANQRAENAATAFMEANNRAEAISIALAEANTRADTIAFESQDQIAAAVAEANAAKEAAAQAAAQAAVAPAPVVSAPTADTSALEQRNTELQTQLSELQLKHTTKIEQANQMLNQGQQRYDALMASFSSLQQKCRDGMQGEEGNMAAIAALEADAQDLRQKLQAQSEEFEKAKADAKKADQYKNELTILTMRWKEAVSEADGVRKLMKDQMAAVAAAAAERAANGDEGGVVGGIIDPEEVHALKQQIQNLKLDAASMESLQSDYASLQRNFDMNQNMLSEARANLEEVRAALTHTQNRLTIAEQQYAELQQTKNLAQSQQDAVVVETSSKQLSELQQSLHHKQHQLSEMQNYTSSLEKDNLNLRKNFESTMAKLKNFSSEEHLVDRRLVVKMLVTYFERKDKDEVLNLMAKMLQFTADDIKRINKGRQGYLGAAWNFLASPVAADQNSAADPNSNLADSWIDFLMQESTKAEQEKTAADAAAQVQLQAAPARPQQRFTPSMPNESEFESRPSRPVNPPTSLPPPMMGPPQFSIPPLGSMQPPVGGIPQPQQQFQQAPPPPWAMQQPQPPAPVQQQQPVLAVNQPPLQPLQPFPPAFSVPNPAFHAGAAQLAPPAFAVPPPAFHPAAPGFAAPPPMFAVPPPIGFPMPPPAMNGVHQ